MKYSIDKFPKEIKKIFEEWDYHPSNYKEADTVFKAYYGIERNKPLKLKAENFDEKNPKYIVIDDHSFPIVSNEVWKQMDDSQKLNLTYKIFDYFCKMYQVKDVKFSLIPKNEYFFGAAGGCFDSVDKILFINPLEVINKKCEPYLIGDTIMHEITHAKHFQFSNKYRKNIDNSNNKFYQFLLINGTIRYESIFQNIHVFISDKNLFKRLLHVSNEKSWNDFLRLMYFNNPVEQAAAKKSLKLLSKLSKLYPDDFKDSKLSSSFCADIALDEEFIDSRVIFNYEHGFKLRSKDIEVLQKICLIFNRGIVQRNKLLKEYRKVKNDNPQRAMELENDIYAINAKFENCCKVLVKIYDNKKMTRSKLVDEIKKDVTFEDDVKSA